MSDFDDRRRIADDPFGKHEALHTAHLATEFFALHVAEHPFVEFTPRLHKLAEEVTMALANFYQEVGREINKEELGDVGKEREV